MIYHWLLSFEDSTWIPRLLCAVEDMLTWTPTYNTPRGWIIPVWWAPRKAVGVYKTGVCKSEVNFFFSDTFGALERHVFFFIVCHRRIGGLGTREIFWVVRQGPQTATRTADHPHVRKATAPMLVGISSSGFQPPEG